jgi:hypothetical protein
MSFSGTTRFRRWPYVDLGKGLILPELDLWSTHTYAVSLARLTERIEKRWGDDWLMDLCSYAVMLICSKLLWNLMHVTKRSGAAVDLPGERALTLRAGFQ